MYDIYHCCVYSEKTPDDGQRNCPKHAEFYSKNKFEKLVHLVGFIIRIYQDARTSESQIRELLTPLRAGRSGIESRWGRDFPPVQTGPGAHPTSCAMGTGSFPGEKCGRVVLLTTHHFLVPRSWKSRAIPLPTLWATPGCNGNTLPFTNPIAQYHIQEVLNPQIYRCGNFKFLLVFQ